MWSLIILFFTLKGEPEAIIADGFPSKVSCLTAAKGVMESVDQQMKDYQENGMATLISARVVCVSKGAQ